MVTDNYSDIKLAYVGSVVPDESLYRTAAFSRAGNMCQLALLSGLISSGLNPSIVLSVLPVPSYPNGNRIFSNRFIIEYNQLIKIKFLSFLNITPLKQIFLGLASLFELLVWGWKHKKSRRIIFTFNISVPPGFFLLLAARLTRSKIVAMVYDINVPGETVPRSPLWVLDYWHQRKCLSKYDGLVVISEAIAQDFAPGVPFLLVEGGINLDPSEQYANIVGSAERQTAYFTIVAAGSLHEANGIRELLVAFDLLEGERYRLLIAGGGPLENLVREAAASDPRIRYVGFVSFKEVLALYAIADVLVNMRLTQRLNTRYFFPSKTMEYIASGVPVISTCPGNMAHEYGQFAYLLQDETPEALAELLRCVERTPEAERREKCKAARKFMAEHKTWDAQARRIRDFLRLISPMNT